MGLGGFSIWNVMVLIVVIGFYILPIIHVLVSKRSRGGAKLGWALGVIFFPIMMVYIVFLIVTQKEANRIKQLSRDTV